MNDEAPQTRWPRASAWRGPRGLTLAALLCYAWPALRWIVGTWTGSDYDSTGFLALPLVALWAWRRAPRWRTEPRPGPLWAAAAVLGVGTLLAPLGVNLVGALCALVALHLWSVAFVDLPGRWFLQPQLYLALAALPVAHWGNVLFGFHLQQLVTRLAGAVLRIYGAGVTVEGTLLRFPAMVVAVDESCSGVRLLLAATIVGLLAGPRRRKPLFWLLLAAGVLVANVTRVVALALFSLWRGTAPPEWMHAGAGLAVFGVVCVVLLARFASVEPCTSARGPA